MIAQPGLTQVEKDKLEIGPDFDFRQVAERPWESFTPNELAMFKWSGIYQQLQGHFFMIRIVTPGGLMTVRQFRRAIDLAEQYAQGQLCITTRQTLQYHWVRKEDLYKMIDGLAEVGLTTKNGCGDVCRNVVTCSLQGACPHEIGGDVRRLLTAIATDPEIQEQQRNLPRKHKISVAGCHRACAQTLMNCQGWVPTTRRTPDGTVESGWILHAGGGLGARPYLGQVIFDWVPEALALPVARAVVEAHRVHGDRRNRANSRLKIVVANQGGRGFAETVLWILRDRGIAELGKLSIPADPAPAIAPAFLDGQGVVPQRQPGLNTVRIIIRRSELSVAEGRELAQLAEFYGNGQLMFTHRQNVELRHVLDTNVKPLRTALHEAGFMIEGHERLPDMVACVGTTQCRMAVSDTTKAYRQILAELGTDVAFWTAVGPLRINLTGCPNNCAHGWIADIGLRGRRLRDELGETSVEGFTILVGGSLAGAGRIAVPIQDVGLAETATAIRTLLETYLAKRTAPAETFGDFVARITPEGFKALLPKKS